MKKTTLFTVALILALTAHAQQASLLMGARGMGLASATSCLTDEWALFNNVAGLAKVDRPIAAFSYDAYPSFKPFNRTAVVFAAPVGPGTAAAGILRFGDDLYNEQILTAGFANTLGLASLGVRINLIQYHAEGFGDARVLTASMGGIATLTPKLSIGAHIVNINQPILNKTTGERVPTLLILGAAFRATEKILVAAEVEKDLDYRVAARAGIEYQLHQKLSARTGFNLGKRSGFAGLGFKVRKFRLDYAYQYNITSGAGHQASVAYYFRKS